MKNIILILVAVLVNSICTAQSVTAGYSSRNGDPATMGVAATYCQGEATSFEINASGTNAGNVFTIQMSDASGSFAAPVNIGSQAGGNGMQTIPATIPLNTPPGSNYAFRVVYSNPTYTSAPLWVDNAVNAGTTYYEDADLDGFGNPLVTEFTCTPSSGFVSDNTDCNDGNTAMHQKFPFYVDADGDSYGMGSLTLTCAVDANTPPANFSTNNTDCDDINPGVHTMHFFYADGDGDGFGAGPIVTACASGPSSPPAGFSVYNSDCNDADAAVHQKFPFYVDSDGDGYGTGFLVAICAVNGMTPPAGYTMINGDCDDANAALHQSFFFYVDADGDTYGAGAPVSQCAVNASTPPAGFSVNNSDCNDGDNQMHQKFPFYVDADGDSFGTGTAVAVCAVNSSTPPIGYANNNADCDDSNGSIHFEYFFYADADGDTYGTGTLMLVCAINETTPPAGYSMNNTDCNDDDPAAWQMGTFFIDTDNDGYTTGVTANVCYGAGTPSGYALTNIGIDCNDFVAAIYPGAPEILFNGVDDNCDGVLDEGQQLFTQVIPTLCGTTMASIGSTIYAVNHNAATMYRFEVTNTSTGAIEILERPIRWFTLTMLEAHEYATTYSIRVELQRNGVWLGYFGPACLVSSPAILEEGGAQVGGLQCDTVLPTIQTIIMTNNIANATGYRFRITNLTDSSAPNQVQTLDRGLRWFSLTMLSTYHYGTSYMIEVAVKTTGTYGGYGAGCIVTTGPVPALVQCSQVVPSANTLVLTQSMNKATSYRFMLTNLSTGVITTIDRPLHWFRFSMFPGHTPGQQYDVQVAVMTSGSYSLYGDACTITAPGAARFDDVKGAESLPAAFKAIAYPNPFTEDFSVDLNDGGEQNVTIRIYDMLGKLVEVSEVPAPEIDQRSFGQGFPGGVYNVIISQGDQVKTLRVIKR